MTSPRPGRPRPSHAVQAAHACLGLSMIIGIAALFSIMSGMALAHRMLVSRGFTALPASFPKAAARRRAESKARP